MLILLILSLPGADGLNDLQLLAYNDLIQNVSKVDQRYTRYLSLHALDDKELKKTALIKSLIFVLNSTSFRSNLYNPIIVRNANNENKLLRINLQSLGWDSNSRSNRFNRLKERKITFPETYPLDIWEEIIKEDIYFYTSTSESRGWLDPNINESFRTITYSSKPLLNGYQVLSLIFKEPLYSTILLHPSKESDLYKVYGVDESIINSDPQLKQGGATLDSIVALHNRELQLIPSLYGKNDRFIWRTFDFNKDNTGDKSVLENFAGTVKHDGREIIGSLPNGLHWFYLANGTGNQVAVVPQDIAIDQRDNVKVKDRSVINAYKCVSCHIDGINTFQDVVSQSMLRPGIGLGIFNKKIYGEYVKANNNLKENLEEYYLSTLHDKIANQQTTYINSVKQCNGLATLPNSQNVNELIESYQYDLVTPVQAQREMALSIAEFQVVTKNSGNPYLVLLGGGQSVRRVAFEKAFSTGMLVKQYTWDKGNQGVGNQGKQK